MKQHEISIKTSNSDAVIWIEKLRQVLLIQNKGKGTVKNYTAEMICAWRQPVTQWKKQAHSCHTPATEPAQTNA